MTVTTTLEQLTLETQDDVLQGLASKVLWSDGLNIEASKAMLQEIESFGNEQYAKTFKEALVIAFCAANDAGYHQNIARQSEVLDLVGGASFKAETKYRNTELLDDYCNCLIDAGNESCAERFQYFGVIF
jgi:hypothetical protein